MPIFRKSNSFWRRSVAISTAIAATTLSLSALAVTPASATTFVVGASGTMLTLNSSPVAITGYNAYSLASMPSVNQGCGGSFNDAQLTAFFHSLPANSLVRFYAFQDSIGINKYTDTIDWTALDRVFSAAAASHVLLIPVLGNEYSNCDDGRYKDLSWFQSGTSVVASASLAAAAGEPAPVLSYNDWVSAVVSRYASSPALGMWEPLNEPSPSTCIGGPYASSSSCNSGAGSSCAETTALGALQTFFTNTAALIHAADSTHLIEAGLQGSGQCGTTGTDYATLAANSGINVLSFHDSYGSTVLGGTTTNGVQARIDQAASVSKPIIDMDNGISAGSSCTSQPTRAIQVDNKAAGQFTAGVAAYLLNNVVPSTTSTCTNNIVSGDPVIPNLNDLPGTQGNASGIIGTNGTQLTLNGSNVKLTGFNAYELGTLWGTNAGCGGQLSNSDMTAFFASLPRDSIVRFNAFQSSIGINVYTDTIDWTALDRVFALAAANHIFLIPVMAGEWGGCDGQFKDLTWFQSGYNSVGSAAIAAADSIPAPVLSYKDWVSAFVGRYAASPALGWYEPIGESEADNCVGAPTTAASACNSGSGTTCSEAAAATALYNFWTTMGNLVHSLDPSHLVEGGFLGGGQCGTQGSDYQSVGSSPGIDVLSFHDYYNTSGDISQTSSPGGDAYNGVLVRLQQAANLVKPIIDGEMGVFAGGSCDSNATRASVISQTAANQISPPSSWHAATSVAAFMQWDFVPYPISPPAGYPNCSYDILSGDPTIAAVGSLSVVPNP